MRIKAFSGVASAYSMCACAILSRCLHHKKVATLAIVYLYLHFCMIDLHDNITDTHSQYEFYFQSTSIAKAGWVERRSGETVAFLNTIVQDKKKRWLKKNERWNKSK